MVSYSERPWTNAYDSFVPKTLEPYPETTLPSFLVEAAQRTPNNIALVSSTRLPSVLGRLGRLSSQMTYAELNQASDAMAHALVEMGLKKGEAVAIIMPNSVAFVVSFYAILKAGGIVAAVNPTYPDLKMVHQLNDSQARFVICMSLFYEQVQRIRPQTSIETVVVSQYKQYLHGFARFLFSLTREKKDGHYVEQLNSKDHWFHDVLIQHQGRKSNVEISHEDMALFQYTGGTTGVAKAAASKHKALVANTLQCKAFLGQTSDQADSFLGAIPMFHVFGMVAVLTFAVGLGAPIYLVPNARDITDVLDTIDTFKPTLFMGVPALFNAINNRKDVQEGLYNLRSIRACISGSAPLPPAVKREFERLSGGVIMEGFGMSETPTATHCNPLLGENRVGSIGLPFPDMDMRIVSLENDEQDVAVGEIGELVMAGPILMEHYHNMPSETAKSMRLRNGKRWFYTGDIGKMDQDGYFYIVDRKKDMSLIGGFNVYPAVVEKALAEHPDIAEVGVAAIPHPDKLGLETLKAWIVIKADRATPTPEQIISFASDRLAAYEVPRRIEFVTELPKTSVGKTLRRELVEMERKKQS